MYIFYYFFIYNKYSNTIYTKCKKITLDIAKKNIQSNTNKNYQDFILCIN